jgi:hypothetical protein
MGYLAEDVDVVVVVLVLLLVLVVEDHFLFGLVDGGLEDLVGPWVLLAPVVFLVLVFEVVVADIGVPIRHADVDALVLEHSGDFSQHLLRVLLGVGATLHGGSLTSRESSMPLSMTQSKVSFSNTPLRFLASAWTSCCNSGYI